MKYEWHIRHNGKKIYGFSGGLYGAKNWIEKNKKELISTFNGARPFVQIFNGDDFIEKVFLSDEVTLKFRILKIGEVVKEGDLFNLNWAAVDSPPNFTHARDSINQSVFQDNVFYRPI